MNSLRPICIATGYESDSALSGCDDSSSTESLSGDTDHTYVPSSLSTVESYSTCYSWESMQTTLTDELSHIRGATPLKELAQQIDNWTKTGSYRRSSPGRTWKYCSFALVFLYNSISCNSDFNLIWP